MPAAGKVPAMVKPRGSKAVCGTRLRLCELSAQFAAGERY